MKDKISLWSKMLLACAALALVISLFVPIWSISLDAPQYPEGLALQIWANSIAGDVDIINGLNHYIGMKTLHSKDFIEFTVLPYIISAYALIFLMAAIRARRRWLNIAFIAFVLFGIIAMIDFWKWEYNYGHDLDPNAAIKVPGMAYQPPLIGFKQLLNFGAYSMPDIGGWLFVVAGLMLLVAVAIENGWLNKWKNRNVVAAFLIGGISMFSSCSGTDPHPIVLNKDACGFCKMTISDARFGAEIITKKGRVYKFDDFICMLNHTALQENKDIAVQYIHNFSIENELINTATAWYVADSSLKSPMGGNVAAFNNKAEAEKYAVSKILTVVNYDELLTGSRANRSEQHDTHVHP